MKYSYRLLVLALCFCGCRHWHPFVQKSEKSVLRKAECNTYEVYSHYKNYCDKLRYIEKRFYCIENSDCLLIIIKDLQAATGINAQITGNFYGVDYESDSVWYADIAKWKSYFKCDSL
jgi:hypothetical protein